MSVSVLVVSLYLHPTTSSIIQTSIIPHAPYLTMEDDDADAARARRTRPVPPVAAQEQNASPRREPLPPAGLLQSLGEDDLFVVATPPQGRAPCARQGGSSLPGLAFRAGQSSTPPRGRAPCARQSGAPRLPAPHAAEPAAPARPDSDGVPLSGSGCVPLSFVVVALSSSSPSGNSVSGWVR